MTYMSNVKDGLRYEMEFCKLLHEHGFWVHRVTPNAAGQQPCDVIAVKGKACYLVDCKLLTAQHGAFRFCRAEENQRNSMTMFRNRCGNDGWFALKPLNGKILMLSLSTIEDLEREGKHSIPEKQLDLYCIPLEVWLNHVESTSAD